MKILNKFIWSKKEPSNKNDIWFDGSTWRMYTEEAWQSFTLPIDTADKVVKMLENASEVYQEKLNAGEGIIIENNVISAILPDLSEYAKINDIATINGQPLTEGGNITIEGGEGDSGLQYAVERTVYPTRMESEIREPTNVEITEEERAYNIETYNMAWNKMEPVFVSFLGGYFNLIGMSDDMAVYNVVSHYNNVYGYNGFYSFTITITKEGDAILSVKQIQTGDNIDPELLKSYMPLSREFSNEFSADFAR